MSCYLEVKLNSFKKLVSQAVADLEISHEEYKSVINEEKMTEDWRKTLE